MVTVSDPAKLYPLLLNTGLQTRDNPTYQVIYNLITTLVALNKQFGSSSSGGGGGGGSVGPQGPTGISGANGLDAIDGIDGLDGSIGPQGIRGLQGFSGNDGLDGLDGIDGIQGPIGLSGINGRNGLDGVDGLDGNDGAIGLTGATGATGATGSSGTQGINGIDGIDAGDFVFEPIFVTAGNLYGQILNPTIITSSLSTVALNTGDKILNIGGSPAGNNKTIINLLSSNTQINWSIQTNVSSGDFEIIPSTAGGGSTFSSPALTLSNVGVLSILYPGIHIFSAAATTENSINLTNTTSSTIAFAALRVIGASGGNLVLASFSQGYSSATGYDIQSSSSIIASGSGGLNFVTNNASTGFPIRWFTGITEKMRLSAVGGLNIGTTGTDPGAKNLSVEGTIAVNGTLVVGGAVILSSIITKYGTITTVGTGVAVVFGFANTVFTNIAATAIASYTPPIAGSFIVSASVVVTTSTAHTFTVVCNYTDAGGTARVGTLTFSNIAGTLLTQITNITGVGSYEGVPLHISAGGGVAITFSSVGTFTGVVYRLSVCTTQVG